MKLLKSALIGACMASTSIWPVYAQWQGPTNAIPYGQGAGVSGFGFAGPCTNNQALFGNTGSPPNCRQPAPGDLSGLGTGVSTALGTNVGTAGSFVVNGGVLGTPSSGTLTNATSLPLSTGVTGNLSVNNLNGGTNAGPSTFWRGDGAWGQPQANNTLLITAIGNTNWTVPVGVTKIILNAVAGGAGSGSVNNGASGAACMAAGDVGVGGQAATEQAVTVIPGHVLQFAIPSGGSAGTTATGCNAANDGGAGGNFVLTDTTASSTLLTLTGGAGYPVPGVAQCATANCFAINAFSIGESSFSDAKSGLQGYYGPNPTLNFPNVPVAAQTFFGTGAIDNAGQCLTGASGWAYGMGGTATTINGVAAANTRCNGTVGLQGAAQFRW